MTCVLSVIVCTYNRADDLQCALETLCNQRLDTSLYEIIVVDNNSTDSTQEVTETFCRRYPNVSYVHETQQGLSHARNRGWREAHGTYVAYTDDDCKLPPQWLVVALQVIHHHAPAVFGGPYFPFYKTPVPRWFKDSYGSNVHAREARVLNQNEFISGGNIFFRRSLLEHLGGFDPGLGMSGQKIAYGEETALLMTIRRTMPNEMIYYDPNLFVFHLVASRKMDLGWVLRQSFARGQYTNRLRWNSATPSEQRYPRLWQIAIVAMVGATGIVFLLETLFALVWRNRTRYPCIENYIYERAFRHIRTLGSLYERLLRVDLARKKKTS